MKPGRGAHPGTTSPHCNISAKCVSFAPQTYDRLNNWYPPMGRAKSLAPSPRVSFLRTMSRNLHSTYLCPNCLSPHVKDAPLSLLLANLKGVDSLNFADAKTLPAPLRRLRTCASCGGEIDLQALTRGKLDYHGWGLRLAMLAAAGAFAFLVNIEPLPALPWIGLGMALASALTWFAVDTAERTLIARFRKTAD